MNQEQSELLTQVIADYVEEYISNNTNDIVLRIVQCDTEEEITALLEPVIEQFLQENEAEIEKHLF